jgi:trans-2-enoyl-CoA reductase
MLLGRRTCRFFGTAIKYNATGVPSAVLKQEHLGALAKTSADEVSIKFLAAPINPSDLNMIEGVYGVSPKLPAVGGNEGVAMVMEVGSNIKGLAVGDWVIPYRSGFGTWRTNATAKESELVKIANDIPAAYAATLSVNPATAHRLLKDFDDLKPGDVIMQNGANSMVGLCVVQMAREKGIKTINIVRSDRPDADKMTRLLANLGGDVNVLDTQVNTSMMKEIMQDLPPCRLALNCVGGETTTEMMRCLAVGGTLVTYGGMSKRPISVPVDLMTYKQLKLKGFWITAWYEEHGLAAMSSMMADLVTMVRNKKLTLFHELHDFDDFDHALRRSQEAFRLRKVVLNMDHPDRFKEHDGKADNDYGIFETSIM